LVFFFLAFDWFAFSIDYACVKSQGDTTRHMGRLCKRTVVELSV
jgi:hypothetical protein